MNTLTSLADTLGRFSARWVPSAFSIAVLLTLLTGGLAIGWAHAAPVAVLTSWSGGFWELLSFSMQMALVMFLGSLLADTKVVRSALNTVAALATGPRSAVVLMALCSMGLAYLNWGLSIIASAVLVRFVARRVPTVDYRLLVACAYFGLGATWHAGLSASAPLTVATPKHFLEAQLGVVPLSRTLFSPFNLGLVCATVAVLTLLAWALHPRAEKTVRIDPALLDEQQLATASTEADPARPGFAARLDQAWWLNAVFGAAALAALALTLSANGWQGLNLNTVNFLFFALAVLLHRSPSSLLAAAERAASSLGGVVLQFPLYAGIYGIFKSTGLTERLGALFVDVSTPSTLPALVYVYSGVVNYFVPSGGAKWAIEGPYLLNAAKTMGVAPEKIVLAYAWGDMATDLIQPFWALPLLSIAKLEFKDVLGFLLLCFFVYAPLVTIAFVAAG